jgi:hypothetical protein
MTNKQLLVGILGILLVFGLVLVGCDNGDTPKDILDGTRWEATFEEDGVFEVVAIDRIQPSQFSINGKR